MVLFNNNDQTKSYTELTDNQQNFLKSFKNLSGSASSKMWNDIKNSNDKFSKFLSKYQKLENMPIETLKAALKTDIQQNYQSFNSMPFSFQYFLKKCNIKNNAELQKFIGGGKKKKSTSKKKVRKIYKGPRGGRYYITKGHKVYI